MLGERGVDQLPPASRPALLVSFAYLDKWLAMEPRAAYRTWALDCGAFTAFKTGEEIDLDGYTETCLRLMKSQPRLIDIFALDCIGGPKAGIPTIKAAETTARNAEFMARRGVPAIPTYHAGEPREFLQEYAAKYPKIAIGGLVPLNSSKREQWAEWCFSQIWPKKVHGFGVGIGPLSRIVPWHSTDATTWELGPCKFGRWRVFGDSRLRIRGSNQNLRAEVEQYLREERKLQLRWSREMSMLNAKEG